jgi:hypothetical protein
MKLGHLVFLSFVPLTILIFMLLVTGLLSFQSSLNQILGIAPLYFAGINLLTSVYGLFLLFFTSRIGSWLGRKGAGTYETMDESLTKAVSKISGCEVEHWNPQALLMDKYLTPILKKYNVGTWLIRIVGLTIFCLSAYNIYEIIALVV